MSMKTLGVILGVVALVGADHCAAALLIDDFEAASQVNVLGGSYFSYTDGYSIILPAQGFASVTGHDSPGAASFDYTLQPGVQYPYVGVGAPPYASNSELDVRTYAGVRFWVRGNGSFRFDIQTSATQAAGNGFESAIGITKDWQLVELPFSEMAQSWAPQGSSPRKWDAQTDAPHVVAYNWTAVGTSGTSGHIEIDQLEFYLPSEASTDVVANVVIASPKTNQVGYLPRSRKLLLVTATAASAGQSYQIQSVDTGQTVYEGALSTTAIDDTPSSGESVLQGDFSGLTSAGVYRASVGGNTSHAFSIAADVYRELFRTAGRTFYLIRSGEAIDDAETTIAHAASHLNDAPLRSDPSTHLDLVGGWYNAGDLGKYSHMEAIAVAYMMLVHELRPRVDVVTMNIPETGNGVPDVLNQARFGLEFLLKMQMPDGSVLHKVDAEPNLPYGILPENDTTARSAAAATSIDTGDFIGALLQAARVYAPYDPAFAARCHDAAQRAWAWLEANPNIASSDPYYVDADPSQERLFALGAMVADGKDATLTSRLVTELASQSVTEVAWMAPALLSLFDVARLPGVDPAAAQAARSKLLTLADSLVQKGQASGYGLLLSPSEIAWESVETGLHRANALLMAYELSSNQSYHDAALAEVDWVLGANALDRAFVTSFGEHSAQRPYHWIFASMNKVMPGWAVGGPNQYGTGADPLLIAVQARGTPPAKCYVDEGIGGGSWASNEGEVTNEAALLFASGYLYAEGLVSAEFDAGSGADAGTPPNGDTNDGLHAVGGGCACRAALPRSRSPLAFGVMLAAFLMLAQRRRHGQRADKPVKVSKNPSNAVRR